MILLPAPQDFFLPFGISTAEVLRSRVEGLRSQVPKVPVWV